MHRGGRESYAEGVVYTQREGIDRGSLICNGYAYAQGAYTWGGLYRFMCQYE